jgi:hypothetical protein
MGAFVASHRLGVLVRYADGAVVLCNYRRPGRSSPVLDGRGPGHARVAVAPDKTGIVDLAGGHAGFDFLGWHHRKVASRVTGQVLPAALAQFAGHELDPRTDTPAHPTSVAHVGKLVVEVAQALPGP